MPLQALECSPPLDTDEHVESPRRQTPSVDETMLDEVRTATRHLESIKADSQPEITHFESIRALHETLTSALRRAGQSGLLDRDVDSLALRKAQLESRFRMAQDRRHATGCAHHIVIETTRSYIRSAERLLDTLVLDYLDDSDETSRAHQRALTRLEDSLSVRRAFATFRLNIDKAQSEPSQDSRLRASATALATLLGGEAHRKLRACDLDIFWGLQRRMRETLRQDQLDISESQRLLDDLVAASSIVGEISQREELRLHDAALVKKLPLEQPPTIGPELRKSLMRLFGVSRSVDAALTTGDRLTDEQYSSLRRFASLGLVYFGNSNQPSKE